MKEPRKIKALIGTLLFHAVLVVLFIFYGLTTPLPLPEERGVEVNLGYSDQGMGEIQPDEPASAKQSNPPPTKSSDDGYLTNENEKAPNLDVPENKKDQNEKQDINLETEEETRKEPEPKVNKRALYPGKQNKTGEGGNEGETGQQGDQGNPYGDPDAKNHYGKPGAGGDGISYKLSGRSAKRLPKPIYNSMEQGKVVVTITVDRKGNVTKAIPGAKGSTTASQSLWRLAKKAALKATFNVNSNAPAEQKGIITYNFIRLN